MRTYTLLTHFLSCFVGAFGATGYMAVYWPNSDGSAVVKPHEQASIRTQGSIEDAVTNSGPFLTQGPETCNCRVDMSQNFSMGDSPVRNGADGYADSDCAPGRVQESIPAIEVTNGRVASDENNSSLAAERRAETARAEAEIEQLAAARAEANTPAHAMELTNLLYELPEPKASDYLNYEKFRAKLYDPNFERDFTMSELGSMAEFANLNPRHAIAVTNEINELINSGRLRPPRMVGL